MFALLLKKQLLELFKGYFVNQKTGKSRSKKSVIGYIVLFGLVITSLGFAFFAMSFEIGSIFINTPLEWLFFSLLGILSIGVGTFGSVLTTANILYQAKDNEFLLSLPIKSKDIVLSRVALVFIMSFIYGAIAWIPAMIYYIIAKGFILIPFLYQLVLCFVITLFVTALTCLLGFVVAYVSSKIKNKSIVRTLITLVLLGAYYAVCFNSSALVEAITNNSENISVGIKTWARIIYYLGNGATGNSLSLLIFVTITAIIFVLAMFVLVRSFKGIVTKNETFKAKKTKAQTNDVSSIEKALLKRETKRFLSSSLYVLNCGIGLVFAIAVAVVFMLNVGNMYAALNEMGVPLNIIKTYAPAAIVCIIGLLLGMNMISTPSISLEGKTLWIIKTLPIDPYKIFVAKLKLHFIPNAIAGVISTIIMSITFRLDVISAICVSIFVLSFIAITDYFGLMIGTMKPNFSWTNESYPIKQSTNVLFAMMFGWALSIASAALCIVLRNILKPIIVLIILSFIMLIFAYLINSWFKKKGRELFIDF